MWYLWVFGGRAVSTHTDTHNRRICRTHCARCWAVTCPGPTHASHVPCHRRRPAPQRAQLRTLDGDRHRDSTLHLRLAASSSLKSLKVLLWNPYLEPDERRTCQQIKLHKQQVYIRIRQYFKRNETN